MVTTVRLLEMSKEDRYHGVTLNMMQRTLFEKNVGLINKDDCTPGRGYLEDGRKVCVNLCSAGTKVRSSDDVQGL